MFLFSLSMVYIFQTSFQSSDVLIKRTEPDEEKGNGVVIAVVVVVVIIALLVVVFGFLLLRRFAHTITCNIEKTARKMTDGKHELVHGAPYIFSIKVSESDVQNHEISCDVPKIHTILAHISL